MMRARRLTEGLGFENCFCAQLAVKGADFPKSDSGGCLLRAGQILLLPLLRGGPVLGEKFAQGCLIAAIPRKSLHDVAKIFFRIHSVMTGADEQAVENGTTISRFRTTNKQIILTTDGHRAHVTLDAVIIDLNLSVINVGEDFFPLIQGVGNRLPEPSRWAGGFAIS